MSIQERPLRYMPCNLCNAEQLFTDHRQSTNDLLRSLQSLGWKNKIKFDKVILTEDWICPVCVMAAEANNSKVEEKMVTPVAPIVMPEEAAK